MSDRNITIKRVSRVVQIVTVGRRGEQGDGATNLVTSVAGRQGAVVLTKADVGLSNVDNTSDTSKPISTAAQTALNAKANTSSLATVATSGSYNDLSNKPVIPATIVQSVVPGTNVTVDSTDPAHPIVSASGDGVTKAFVIAMAVAL
jgi:hypothetical protein